MRELRDEIGDIRRDLLDFRREVMAALGTIIDAIADLRAEHQQHTHE